MEKKLTVDVCVVEIRNRTLPQVLQSKIYKTESGPHVLKKFSDICAKTVITGILSANRSQFCE